MNFIPITVAQGEDVRDVLIDADRSYRLEKDGYFLATYYTLDEQLLVCPPRTYKLIKFNGSETFGDIRFDEEPKVYEIPDAQFSDDYLINVLIEHDGVVMSALWSSYYEFDIKQGSITGVLRDHETLQRLPFKSAKLINIDGHENYMELLEIGLEDDEFAGRKVDLGFDIRKDGDRFLVPLKLSGYEDTVFIDLSEWNDTTRASDDFIIHGDYYDAEDRPIRPLGVTECFAGYTIGKEMVLRYLRLKRGLMKWD